MVKTPRTHHSKTVREPVTIDLQPGEVSRVKAEAEKAGADKPNETGAPETGSAASPKPAAAAKEPEASPQIPKEPDPKPAEKPKQASASDGPAFGRSEPPRVPPGKAPPGDPVGKPAAAATEPAPRSRSGALLAGVAGGVIALLAAGGLSVAGLLPGGGTQLADPAPAIAALEAQIADVQGQVAELGALRGDEDLAGRIAQSEERVAALASELETLRGAVAGLGTEGQTPSVDLGPIEARIAALETAVAEGAGGETVSPEAALAALDERVAPLRQDIASLREEIGAARESQGAALARLDALEETLSRLSGRVDEQAEAPATAAIIAVSALKAAIDRGSPFTTELETWASLAPDAPQIEALRVLAAEGVATRAQLAAESDAAANAMIAAAQPVDPDAGVLDRLWGSAMGLVQVRPIGMVEGEGVPEIAARIDAAVAANDYPRAIAEFETLPEAAKAAGEPFMARVRARHEADLLVDEALAAALKA